MATTLKRLLLVGFFAVGVSCFLSDGAFAQTYLRLAQMRLPPGSYTYTCHSCRFDGRLLSCRCRTSDGQSLRSSMDWGGTCSNSEVSNHEGQLVCAAR
jgi:hypothetical protein